ncbi:hypothetical protein RclHR1_11100008 [Rhizophagus clarus]|uniref:Kinase-like domain-containing protein n=1 Tax=Rhizophagus clarus TaxID=94130 RepID=A0A2Z6Q3K8_9GLOM|nr:hypothetical protein RclHR1_11100008 [Rhizophagus clarus]GET04157.1 kinase-like domain-containing protein [Rhizophagus clarus]
MNNELEKFEDSDDEPTLDLDFNMMKQLVSSRLDRNCVKTCRLSRGANNEIHLLQFDNGPDCIARLPRNSINPAEKLACEVATMKYIAQNTKIKVPEVYDWDCTTHNIIKFPYILMERLPGQHLYRVWDELTIENKINVLSQIVDILFEIWNKCQFNEIGCLYMNKGRDAIPSFTGPFKSSREWFDVLIQKEKCFFETHGVQVLIDKMNMNLADAEKRTAELVKQLALLQLKLSKNNPFESIDLPPFTLIHYDFDAQNILVDWSSVDNTIKIVGIIDWEFSHTGTLWELCDYPIWIQEIEYEPYEFVSDKELQRNQENQGLRVHFRNEVIKIFGEKGGKILDMKEKDRRIESLETMFTMVHGFSMLECYLRCFIDQF